MTSTLKDFEQIHVTYELSQKNEKLLRGAYRHPFEYINPKLYRDKDVMNFNDLKQVHM